MGSGFSRKFRRPQILEVDALEWDYIPKGRKYVSI